MLGQWVLNPFAFEILHACGRTGEAKAVERLAPAALGLKSFLSFKRVSPPRPPRLGLGLRPASPRNDMRVHGIISNDKFQTSNLQIQNSNFKLQNSKSKVQIKTNSVQFSPIQPNAVQFNSIQFVCCYLSFVFGLINGDRPDGSSD